MRKSYVLILIFLLACTEVWAEAGTIVVKGVEKACAYNSIRGRGRLSFKAEVEGKGLKISVPENQCGDLLYLIADGIPAWVRVLPGETVVVDAGKNPWKFSKDGKAVNRYLYEWTQEYWFGMPNMLTGNVQMMFHEVAEERRVWPEVEELYTPACLEWVKNWEKGALADLEAAGLDDEAFVEEQKDRIHYNWLEMQFSHYRMAKSKVDIPAAAFDFLGDVRFDQASLLKYPGCDNVLSGYFDMADEAGLFEYTTTDYLRKRAERIAEPALRERYVLGVLQQDFDYGLFYQGEEILASVEGLILSEQGRKTLEKCRKQCADWRASKDNPEGKKLLYFDFEDYHGNRVSPLQFKGKYLLIDIWATWCAPCKYQIPYLKKLSEELKDRAIAFLSISVDKQKDKEAWKKMLQEFGLEDHGVIAPDAFNHQLFESYGVNGIPHFILVDPKGKVVTVKARRPSETLLKMQLEELLDAYEQKSVTISGKVKAEEGAWVSLTKRGGMSDQLAMVEVVDGRFKLTASIEEPGFYFFYSGNKISSELWLEPGDRIEADLDAENVFTGGTADLNNMMVSLNRKYPLARERVTVCDRKRAKALWTRYTSAVKDVEASSLSRQKKGLLTGYWQWDLLSQMYGAICQSKVFGKAHQRPEVERGYSATVVKLKLVPELVHYSQWLDYMQEYLYARMEAGMIRIRTEHSWLADLAGSIEDEDLREEYVINALKMDILRGYLHGVEARIESVRPWVRKQANLKLLEEFPAEIAKKRKQYEKAQTGADLSAYSFEDATGKQVALGDFKGKYVFIDIWSTGCNPCIGEIPYVRDMEHRFAGKPIAWVSLSMDTKKDVWLNFLKKNNMNGVQLLCNEGFKNPFCRQIGLSGIPHFLLLDKEGKVVDVHTLRPSNPVLGELLELLLN